jgi:diguanylate cyclase (GGDEF)-like protein/PAS domain S-box-containing protein
LSGRTRRTSRRGSGTARNGKRAPRDVEPELWEAAFEASPCPTLLVDDAGRIILVNSAAESLLGYSKGSLRGRRVDVLVPREVRARHSADRQRFVREGKSRPMGQHRDLYAVGRDGQRIAVEVGLTPFRTARASYAVCALVDLTERKRFEARISEQAAFLREANERLAELATTDSLTALWNRRAFFDQLGIQLQQAARAARPLSMLLLDLDGFKAYNDRYGHLAGDEVLRITAGVLRHRARRSDYVARIGGEEFGILLPESDRVGAVRLGERFRSAIAAFRWPLRNVTVSVGASTIAFSRVVPRPAVPSYSDVLAAADRALYHSKALGRNRVSHVDDLTASVLAS